MLNKYPSIIGATLVNRDLKGCDSNFEVNICFSNFLRFATN